jgi:hypothetical protein
MRRVIELSTTVPHGEPCVQLGQIEYPKWSRLEARVLIGQIKREFGNPPESTILKMISCNHAFGTYQDVVVIYNDKIQESGEYAFNVESSLPEKWDSKAIEELKAGGYPVGEYYGSLR